MPPQIAAGIFVVLICGLFVLDRDSKSRTSPALWIPVIWVLLAGSRMVSQWLQLGTPIMTTEQFSDGSPLDRNVLIGLLTLGLIVLFCRGQKVGALLRRNGPILLFFAYCTLSVAWSDYPAIAGKRLFKALGDLVMILIVLTDMDRGAAIKEFLARAGFLLIPTSVLFIKYFPALGVAYDPWVGAQSHTGVCTDKNMLGMICLIFGTGCVWRLCEALHQPRLSWRHLAAQGMLLMMVLWLFWKANSMTSLSCFVMASAILVGTTFFKLARRRAALHTLVAAMVVTSFSVLFLDIGSWILPELGRNETLTGRSALWSHLVVMAGQKPLFGAGLESFWLGPRLEPLWAIFAFHPNEAHNGYLEILLNLGGVGLLLLAVILVRSYRNSIRRLYWDPAAGRLGLAYWIIAVTYSFTEAGFRMMNPVWILFLMTGMTFPQLSAARLRRRAAPVVAGERETETEIDKEEANAGAEVVSPGHWMLQGARAEAPAYRRNSG
jgi:exopolysaccharide production protein ExoQ